MAEEKTIKTNSLQAWILASRPKTLAAAAAPVVCGTSLAISTHTFKPVLAFLCLMFAFLMQIAANFINDLFDYLKGTDKEDRLGPQRAMAQGWITQKAMYIGISVVVVLSAICGLTVLPFLKESQILTMIYVGVFCIFFAYFYTSGPFPLSYNGLGDVSVVVFFGIVACGFTFYVQYPNALSSEFGMTLGIGVATGLAVNTLLCVNNYRDRDTDKRDGKKTLIAIFGKSFGEYLYLGCGLLAAILFVVVFGFRYNFVYVILFIIPYLVRHILIYEKMKQIGSGQALNKMIAASSLNMTIFAITVLVSVLVLG